MTMTPLLQLTRKGIFEHTHLGDWTDEQAHRAVEFLVQSRIAALPRPKYKPVSDPDRKLLYAEIRIAAERYIFGKIEAEYKRRYRAGIKEERAWNKKVK